MRFGINKKVMSFFLTNVVIFAVIVGGSLYVIKTLYNTIYEMEALSRKADITGSLRFRAGMLPATINHYLISGDIGARDDFDTIVNGITELLANIRDYKGNEKWDRIASLVESDAIRYGEKGLDILYIENPVGSKRGAELIKELDSIGRDLIREAEEFHRIADEEAKLMEAKASRLTWVISVSAVAISGFLFISIWPLYHYLRKFLITPIRQIHEGAAIIAGRDLSHRLDIHTGDELEDLAVEFNKMASSLEEAKKELDKKILELYTLYNVSKVLSTSFEHEELLTMIVENVSRGLKIDRVMIMLVDERADSLYISSHTGSLGFEAEKRRFKIGEGFYGAVAKTGKAGIVNALSGNGTPVPEDLFGDDACSVISVPFSVKNRTLGLLNAFKKQPDVFNEADLDLLVTVSEHIALALENARLYKETQQLAITDGLTGLYNHRSFRQRLKDEVGRAERYRHSLSIIMIDIDYFKKYNDLNGHPAGDFLLRELGALFKGKLRTTDFLARYGGEEFVVLLPETGKDSAVAMAERIRSSVADYPFPFRESQPGGLLTISLGVATFDTDAAGDDELIKKADQALYKAKDSGKNTVVAYS